ncbi:type I-E CRISPR-associated protein Cas7/Cse4/CasC [Roseiarcus sp.]|uniref:type I-E CRISPR-associated protein Cas7/Cse4/CasC n=1 Tax=Roseiarcus sp. TaxID=1969460 RepID=UPI003F9E9E88
MSDFLQLHVLTAYPPSNPNRDDLGRPKTATIGGSTRQRISSQAIKRAIRTSEPFATALNGHQGQRTQRLGDEIFEHLKANGVSEDKARAAARDVAAAFGKLDDKKSKDEPDPLRIRQLAFVSPDERRLATELAEKVAAGEKLPKDKDLAKAVLQTADGAVDIAMFGRMLADNPDFNRDAAVQVAHAFTTNAVDIEDDYYTAVDDLKTREEDAGAGFVGETGFGAGVYYIYVCVDRGLLVKNLGGDAALAARGLEALVRALATASPSGKRNSFANHVRPEFILAEKGTAQPRSLASAFTRPVDGEDQIGESIARLRRKREAFAAAYGKDWTDEKVLHVGQEGTATLDKLAAFASDGLEGAGA